MAFHFDDHVVIHAVNLLQLGARPLAPIVAPRIRSSAVSCCHKASICPQRVWGAATEPSSVKPSIAMSHPNGLLRLVCEDRNQPTAFPGQPTRFHCQSRRRTSTLAEQPLFPSQLSCENWLHLFAPPLPLRIARAAKDRIPRRPSTKTPRAASILGAEPRFPNPFGDGRSSCSTGRASGAPRMTR